MKCADRYACLLMMRLTITYMDSVYLLSCVWYIVMKMQSVRRDLLTLFYMLLMFFDHICTHVIVGLAD